MQRREDKEGEEGECIPLFSTVLFHLQTSSKISWLFISKTLPFLCVTSVLSVTSSEAGGANSGINGLE
jgi:hypothetical protein